MYRRFKPADLEGFVPYSNDWFDQYWLGNINEVRQLYPVLSVYYGGFIAGVMGVLPQYPGVLDIWSVTNIDTGRRHALSYVRDTRNILELAVEVYKPRRINSLVKANSINSKWNRLLGFEEEFIMREASPEATDMIGLVLWPK
jgi:hypothetical protein